MHRGSQNCLAPAHPYILVSDMCPDLGRSFTQVVEAGRHLASGSPQCTQRKGLTSESRWKPAYRYYRETIARMDMIPPRILIADDQPDVLNALRLLLKGQGYETEGVASPAELLG